MKLNKFKIIIPAIIVALLLGCGYNPETPAYDTAANLERFPKPALELIDNIESRSYQSPDDIINSFVNLYTAHNELLDNKAWKEVITKLGMKFRYRADLLIKEGVKNYAVARETYSLAAFAKPNDKKIEKLSKLFFNWQGELADSILSIDRQISEQANFDLLKKQIENLKDFISADSSRFEFSDKYLFQQLFGDVLKKPGISKYLNDSLDESDQLFLSSVGLLSFKPENFYAFFENPDINLAGYKLTSLGENSYRVELYFVPLENIEEDYAIAFWVNYEDSLQIQAQSRSKYFPYDFLPLLKTSQWRKNKIQIANNNFDFSGDISEISVGLYLEDDKNISYLPVSQSDSQGADSLESKGNIIKLPININ